LFNQSYLYFPFCLFLLTLARISAVPSIHSPQHNHPQQRLSTFFPLCIPSQPVSINCTIHINCAIRHNVQFFSQLFTRILSYTVESACLFPSLFSFFRVPLNVLVRTPRWESLTYMKVILCPMLFDFLNSFALFEVPHSSPACPSHKSIRRRVWNNGGMILTGDNRRTGRKFVLLPISRPPVL